DDGKIRSLKLNLTNNIREKRKEKDKKIKKKYKWLKKDYKEDKSEIVRWEFNPVYVRDLIQENAWVGMLTQSITKEIAKTPWSIIKVEDSEEKEKIKKQKPTERKIKSKNKQVEDSKKKKYEELLKNPNADDSYYDLTEKIMSDLLEIGNTVIYHNNNLVPLPPEEFVKVLDEEHLSYEKYYIRHTFNSPKHKKIEKKKYNKENIIWETLNNRTNRNYGLPPALMCKEILELLDMTLRQEEEYFERNSISSGVLNFENYNKEEIKEWENKMNNEDKPGGILAVAGKEGKVDFEKLSYNYQELQFKERLQFYAKVIASTFQVPISIVGLKPERVNKSTFKGEEGNFDTNTIIPHMRKYESFINKNIITDENYLFVLHENKDVESQKLLSDKVIQELKNDIIDKDKAKELLDYK
ncbi:MAG: phage portal protein, partial [Candidatus Woesearchaeota archaeon]